MKNGKVTRKEAATRITEEEAFGVSDIPADVKADLQKQNLVPRWLNARVLQKNQGYHPRGWKVYKRAKDLEKPMFALNSDPDGIVRKGDLILGVKTKHEHTLHAKYNAQRRRDMLGKEEGREFRETVERAGSHYFEGDED